MQQPVDDVQHQFPSGRVAPKTRLANSQVAAGNDLGGDGLAGSRARAAAIGQVEAEDVRNLGPAEIAAGKGSHLRLVDDGQIDRGDGSVFGVADKLYQTAQSLLGDAYGLGPFGDRDLRFPGALPGRPGPSAAGNGGCRLLSPCHVHKIVRPYEVVERPLIRYELRSMSPRRETTPAFPYVVELPPASSRWHKPARWARASGYVLFFAALTTACVQLHVQTSKKQEDGRKADRLYREAVTAYEENPTEANRQAAAAAAAGVTEKRTKGAIGRWRKAVRQFWAGRNIYQPVRGAGAGDPLTGELLPGASVPPAPPPRPGAPTSEIVDSDAWLHPNMPFVVILLTPITSLPPQATVAAWNVLKVLALLAAIFAVASVANHGRHRMGEWVAGLAVLLAMPLVISDVQHGNSNVFVLAAIAGHLWLYRRGRDGLAGIVLALAICLKMTPALFVAYWLYQRNWRLLAATLQALAVMAVLLPLAVLGPAQYNLLMGSWLGNLIVPGLLKGAPYPIHINQSLSGVFSRLLMRGNIQFNPDDMAVAEKFDYVNILSIPQEIGRYVLLAVKLAIVGAMAWSIGWRKLPRNDGRRGLHYALVVTAILILNQRTWDHHAVILLVAYMPLWYAVAYGRFGRGRRIVSLAGMVLAGLLVWGMSGSLYPGWLADVIEAYGPTFAHFVVLLVVCLVMLGALRKAEKEGREPYAPHRQRL